MTENDLNKKFKAAYLAIRPDADVYKTNDRVTPGRPDFAICDAGQTWYVEGKKWDGELSEHQTRCLARLERNSRGRTAVIWYQENGSAVFVPPGHANTTCATLKAAAAQLAAWILARALDNSTAAAA